MAKKKPDPIKPNYESFLKGLLKGLEKAGEAGYKQKISHEDFLRLKESGKWDNTLKYIHKPVFTNKITPEFEEAIKKFNKNYAEGGQTDPPGLMQQFITSLGFDIEHGLKFNNWLQILAEAESFSGKRQKSDTTSAKGLYHFTDDSIVTAKNRLNNIAKKHTFNKEFIDKLTSEVDQFTEEGQAILTLANLLESPDAPLKDWMAGKVDDKELYYKGHHTDAKNAISSKEKVFENWDNAKIRQEMKNRKFNNGGWVGANPIQNITNFKNPMGVDIGGGSGGFDFLNFLGDLGGIPGLGIAAGLAGSGLSILGNSITQRPDYNEKGISVADFDLRADHTRKTGRKMEKTQEGFDAVGGALKSVPVVGPLLGGVTDLFKGVTSLFGSKSSKQDVFDEYMNTAFRPYNQQQRKALYANAFAAAGGSYENYMSMLNPDLTKGGIYNVQSPLTHEQNPNGGIVFNQNEMGGKDFAEGGEVIIDGPNKEKLVFTNRF